MQSHPLRLLVIDSLGALLATTMGGSDNPRTGHFPMITLARQIKALAVEHHLAVLITNHTVDDMSGFAGSGSASEGQKKFALGMAWEYVADVRLALFFNTANAKSLRKVAVLTKSTRSVFLFRVSVKTIHPHPNYTTGCFDWKDRAFFDW